MILYSKSTNTETLIENMANSIKDKNKCLKRAKALLDRCILKQDYYDLSYVEIFLNKYNRL